MRCTKCRLHQTCSSIKIDGRGSETPEILFVGQAPGQQEDRQASCFVGPAGRLLTEAINEFDLKPSRLTNLVRCFPPGDRPPKADEVLACRPYLAEEIRKYKPKIVVLLGGVPLKGVTGMDKITTYSGTVVAEKAGIKYFALFHPSYVLRYPQALSLFNMHLRALQALHSGRTKFSQEPKFEIIPAEKLPKALVGSDYVSFDLETTGKYKFEGGAIRICGFHSKGKTWIIEAKDKDFREVMDWFSCSNMQKVGHGSRFESRWFLDEGWRIPHNLVMDTLLAHVLLDEEGAHDLESVASEFLEAERWGIEPVMAKNGWDWATVPMEVLAPYNSLDCAYTSRLVAPLLKRLEKEDLTNFLHDHFLPLSDLCAKLEHKGLKIDLKWAARVSKEYRGECEVIRQKFIRNFKLSDDFNMGSSKQLGTLLKKVGIKTGQKTDGGEMSVSEEALKPLKDKHPMVKAYLDWKGNDTICNNFLDKFPRFVDTRGIIHPNVNPGRIVTGRLAVKDPPAQNIPDEKDVKGMVVPQNGTFLYLDFDQLELRLVSSEAGDEVMMRVFERGLDPHDETAKEMFGKNFTEDDRAVAKSINFLTVYGGSDYTLSQKFNVPIEKAAVWISKHAVTYPKIYNWMRQQHQKVIQDGFIRSACGRVRHLPDIKYADEYLRARILRQTGNFPIQSLGAYLTNLLAIHLDWQLRNGNFVANIIHDAVLLDIDRKDLVSVADLCLITIRKFCQPFCKVELKASFAFGPRFGEFESIYKKNGKWVYGEEKK